MKRWILTVLTVLLVIAGILAAASAFMLARIPQHRADVQAWLLSHYQLEARLGAVQTSWHLYGPELVVDGLELRQTNAAEPLLRSGRLRIAWDPLTSLSTGRLAALRLTLDHASIALQRNPEGRLEWVGRQDTGPQATALNDIPVGRLRVRDSRIQYRDLRIAADTQQTTDSSGQWTARHIDFTLVRRPAHMTLHGKAELPAGLGGLTDFSGRSSGSLADVPRLEWKLNIAVQRLDLATCGAAFPELTALQAGTGHLTVSARFRGSDLQQVAGGAAFAGVVLTAPAWETALPAPRVLQFADEAPVAPTLMHFPAAAIAYREAGGEFTVDRTTQGWSIAGRKLLLVPNVGQGHKGSVGEGHKQATAIRLDYSRTEEGGLTVDAQASHAVLDDVWPLLAFLPESDTNVRLRALQAQGTVERFKLHLLQDKTPDDVHYRAEGKVVALGFKPVEARPGVSNLTVSFKATEASGEAAFEGTSMELQLPQVFRAPLPVETTAGSVSWQRAPNGWQVNGKHLRLKNADGQVRATLQLNLPNNSTSSGASNHDTSTAGAASVDATRRESTRAGKAPVETSGVGIAGAETVRVATSPLIDLHAEVDDLQVAATPRYLPAGRLGSKAMHWFDKAFVGGRVTHGEVILRGPLRQFPFRHGTGEFTATAHVTNGALDYQEGWAPLENATADLTFHNEGLEGHADSGTLNGLHIDKAFARIADLGQSELAIKASVRGDFSQGLALVQSSPIGPQLGRAFMSMRGAGAANFEAELWLPLRHLGDRRIDIDTRLQDSVLGVVQLPQQLTQLAGTLRVHDRGLGASNLRGVFLGAPVVIQTRSEVSALPVASQAKSKGIDGPAVATVITAQGGATADELVRLIRLPSGASLSGAAQWQFAGRLQPGDRSHPAAQGYAIDSNLRGLQIGLPEPVRKAAAEPRDLHIVATVDEAAEGNAISARASLGDLRAALRLVNGSEGWGLERGGIRVDGTTAALPDHPGLRVEGTLATLVLDDWFKLSARLVPAPAAAPVAAAAVTATHTATSVLAPVSTSAASGKGVGRSEVRGDGAAPPKLAAYLRAANLRVGQLKLFGYSASDVRGVLQATSGGWQVDVSGPQISGGLLVPYQLTGSQPLTAKLEHLVVGARADTDTGTTTVTTSATARTTNTESGSGSRSSSVSSNSVSNGNSVEPLDFPSIEARIEDLEFAGRDLGAVDLKLERVADGLKMTQFTARNGSFTVDAEGSWLTTNVNTAASTGGGVGTNTSGIAGAGQTGHVQFTLKSTDVRETLHSLGYGDIMAAKHGELQATFDWPGGIDDKLLGRASGTMKLDIGNGQLLSVQPGAGRVLGWLSIAALPRRLSLDFSDLTDKGLSFDTVRGDFEITAGNAYTSNLLLSGPAADIGVVGRTGLGARDYDQTAVVTGSLGSSLPVAGALAGGPVVGAALLLFTHVFKEPLKGITRGYYKISGSWDKPQVERIDAAEAKDSTGHDE